MGRRAWWMALVALAACGAPASRDQDPDRVKDDPFCASTPWYFDGDRDGYGDSAQVVKGCAPPDETWVRVDGDCADHDATRHPGAVEQPDRRDDDCDGRPDNGTAWWDDDGDGFCDDPVGPCSDPAQQPGDCDDTQSTTHPGAVELCDRLDNDCDGALPVAELDGDGDGWPACDDCSDVDDTRHPGRAEACNDIDDDCDGVIDDGDSDGDGWPGCPSTGGALDLLVVLDTSSSMNAERARLAAQARPMFEQLEALRVDWQVGVLEAQGSGLLGATIRPGETDGQARFRALVEAGGSGVGLERPLRSVVDFLDGAEGQAWRRRGASLAVWVLTDEDDQSDLSLDEVLDRMVGELHPSYVTVSTVSGGWDGCGGSGTAAVASPRLQALVERTGGASSLVCRANWTVALDQDWLPALDVDCDDEEPAAWPGAVEACDGIDNDCDGRVDEDGDGDRVSMCDGDCDDRDRSVHPGAAEACNGRDDDCDGLLGAEEVDADGDGFLVCAGDCADADPSIHPRAVEVCGDGVDADCDGVDGGTAAWTDQDGDRVSVCEGDCDDTNPRVFPFAPEHRFNGVDDDCDGDVDGADDDRDVVLSNPTSHWGGTVRSGRTLATFCGVDHGTFTMTSEGYVLFGEQTAWVSGRPDEDDLRDHAPMLAAGWSNLDPTRWTQSLLRPGYLGQPVSVIRRGDATSFVWDHVPYQTGGGFLTAVATVGPNLLRIHVLEGRADTSTLVGYACQDMAVVRLDLDSDPVCADGTSAGATWPGLPGDIPHLVTNGCP